MPRIVYCQLLKREAEGLDRPPHPGPLGERIYANISREGWQRWLSQLTVLMNDFNLNTGDPASIPVIEQYMLRFLFGEGEPVSAAPARRKK